MFWTCGVLFVYVLFFSRRSCIPVYKYLEKPGPKIFATVMSNTDRVLLSRLIETAFDVKCWSYFETKSEFDSYECFIAYGKQPDFYQLHQLYPDAYFVVTTGKVKTIVQTMHDIDLNVVDSIRHSLLYVKKFNEYFEDAPNAITLSLEETDTWPKRLGLFFDKSIDIDTVLSLTESSKVVEIERIICDTRWTYEIRTVYNCPILDEIPTILTVGAQKAGTESFLYMMGQNGQSYPKEVHYFNKHENVSLSGYLNQLPNLNFSRWHGFIHEKTVNYLAHAARVAKVMPPSTKIIILVRDPVQRFMSEVRHHEDVISPYKNQSHWTEFWPYDKCIHKPPIIFKGLYDACYEAFERGMYIDQILEWTRYFDNVWVDCSELVWQSEYDWKHFETFLGQKLQSKMVQHHSSINEHPFGLNITFTDEFLSTLQSYYAPYNVRLKNWFKRDSAQHHWITYKLPSWLEGSAG